MVLFRQLSELYRRDHWSSHDAGASACSCSDRASTGAPDGRISIRGSNCSDSRDSTSSRACEPGCNAVHRAHANLRRSHPPRRSARAGNPDGSHWSRCALGRAYAGSTNWRAWAGTMGHIRLRWVRCYADCVRSLEKLLALNRIAGSGRLLHDAADVLFEHAHSVHGSRSSADESWPSIP